MIILEGPDGSGKSTLAALIGHELNLPVHHFGPPPQTEGELTRRVNFLFENHDKYVFDRIPLISELIYCVLRGKPCMLSEDSLLSYFNQLREAKPTLIYCRPPDELLMDVVQKEHDDDEHIGQVIKKQAQLISRYDELFEECPHLPPFITYDFTTQEHDLLITKLLKGN